MSRINVHQGFSDLSGALWVLKNRPGLRSYPEMVSVAEENGHTVADRKEYRVMSSLKAWGLADSKQHRLTPEGDAFYSLWQRNRATAIDVLHGLQYSLWTQHAPTQHLASWTYQRVCDYLWNHQMVPKSRDFVNYIYDSLEDLGESHVNSRSASVNRSSVTNTYGWLLPLSPPVLKGVRENANGTKDFRHAGFTRRPHCSPALFLMGLSWVMREAGNQLGDLVAIDAERKDQVCRFCLIESIRFDAMLSETHRHFSFLSTQRTDKLHYVVVGREPAIADF